MHKPHGVRSCLHVPLQLSARGRVGIVLELRINKRKVDFEILCVYTPIMFMHLFTIL